MGVNRAEWRNSLLGRLGSYQLAAFRAFGAWELAESGPSDQGPGYCNGVPGEGAKWNPLNTTKTWPKATNYNSVGVKNYATFVDGREATVATLLLPAYEPIIDAITTDYIGVPAILEAIGSTPWGTSTAGLLAAWETYKTRPTYYNGWPIGA